MKFQVGAIIKYDDLIGDCYRVYQITKITNKQLKIKILDSEEKLSIGTSFRWSKEEVSLLLKVRHKYWKMDYSNLIKEELLK